MSSPTGAAPASSGRTRAVRAATLLAAILIDVGIWVGAGPIGGVRLEYSTGRQTATVGIASVIVTAAVAGLLAWGLWALLSQLTRHAAAIWTTVAVIVVAASLASPILMAHSRPAMTALVSLHVATAVIVITGFRLSNSIAGRHPAAVSATGKQMREPTS